MVHKLIKKNKIKMCVWNCDVLYTHSRTYEKREKKKKLYIYLVYTYIQGFHLVIVV